MMSSHNLLNYNLDDIPRYILMRDVLGVENSNDEMISLKDKILSSKWVTKVTSQQWKDGSWGRFHSLSTYTNAQYTTESALRRLLILGLDKDDEPIKKVINYMEKYLKKELDLRDYKEKKHDWNLLTRLFVITWLRVIDRNNELANDEAKKWAKVVSSAFSSGFFDEKKYIETYKEILKPEAGKSIWRIQNYYLVALLPGLLDKHIEENFVDYIINEDKGIYYIYDGNLTSNPVNFDTRQASRYIYAYDLMSEYPSIKSKADIFKQWILSQTSKDGLWDMGPKVKDDIHFPISNSWRKAINRKVDCSIRIMRVMNKLENW